jgi:preprotein translocase subunit SecD
MVKFGWKIWLLIFVILGSLLLIFPLSFERGVQVASIEEQSEAYELGLRKGDILIAVNNQPILSLEDYSEVISALSFEGKTKLELVTTENEFVLFTNETPRITVQNIEKTRIQTGLDLSGGARALVSADKPLSASELNDLISVTHERLDVYGLKDVTIRPVTDLAGDNHMLVEIAGSTPQELEELITQQGNFEAKIGNDTVFVGGEKDITYVARSGDQSGIYSCSALETGHICQFRFSISLREEAAQRHASITSELGNDPANVGYLDKQLDLYLDGNLIDSLFISTSLKGSPTTQISISGSGQGATRQEALDTAEIEMKQLQTVLITGSLPFTLQVEKLDIISPLLGERFLNTIIIAGLAAIAMLTIIIFVRYRKIELSLAVLLTSVSEVIIILGVSSLFKINLNLPAIAGIIAAIGTGVDSQIIILDEAQIQEFSLKERIRRALYIIIGTYVTTLFALLPLLWAGAGLLKGFAITTIIGISIGVFITRPAFSEIVKRITRE